MHSSPSRPVTSHCVRCVSRIQPLLQATQQVASAFRIRSTTARTGFRGSRSFTIAKAKSTKHQKMVLRISSVAAITPRSAGGRKPSMLGACSRYVRKCERVAWGANQGA